LMMQPNLLEYHKMLATRPLLAVFLVIFVIFGSFGMIALLTGVITEAMFEKNVLRLQEEQHERESARKYISQRCSQFFNDIKTNEFGEAMRLELVNLLPKVAEMLDSMNVHFTRDDLVHMLEVMDTDGSGAINKTEFCRALLHLAERGEELQPILMMELQQDAITFVKRKVERLETSVGRIERMQGEVFAVLQGISNHLACSPVQPPSVADGSAQASASSDVAAASSPSPSTPPPDPCLATESRQNTAEPEVRGANGMTRSPSRDSHLSKDRGATLHSLKEAVLKMDQTLCRLQGDMFSIGARVEEVVSDARSEQISSQLGELAVRRRCMEFESSVSGRLSAAENAARQAQKAAEGSSAQVAALVTQVQSLAKDLEGNLRWRSNASASASSNIAAVASAASAIP